MINDRMIFFLFIYDKNLHVSADVDSDDNRPMDEIIQQSGDSFTVVKKSPTKPMKKLTGAGGLHLYKRKMRCKRCKGCLAKDCGICRHCL